MSLQSFLVLTSSIFAPEACGKLMVCPEDDVASHHEVREPEPPATDRVALDLVYTSEVMAVVDGGIDRGVRYLDNLDIVLEADLERLIGLEDAELLVYGLYNNGTSISELAGDAFAVSNIETGTEAVRLYEAWIDKRFGGVSVRAGLYDLNSEFDALETSSLFVGSAHGIGADISQTGQNGPSIFPSTSLAVRLEANLTRDVTLRAAVLDAVPGNPDRPGATVIRLGNGEGALGIAEVDLSLADARLLIGHWRYTAEFETYDGLQKDGNDGFYIRGEAPLAWSTNTQLNGFLRFGIADGRFNPFSHFASGGIKLTGFIGNEDEAGIAVAHAWTSDHFRQLHDAAAGETVFELTWRSQILPSVAVQPSMQYVLNPSADPTIGNALVLGLRTELSVRF